jgi:hypothetical protein
MKRHGHINLSNILADWCRCFAFVSSLFFTVLLIVPWIVTGQQDIIALSAKMYLALDEDHRSLFHKSILGTAFGISTVLLYAKLFVDSRREVV